MKNLMIFVFAVVFCGMVAGCRVEGQVGGNPRYSQEEAQELQQKSVDQPQDVQN